MADKTNYLVSHFSLYRATAYAVFESTWFYLLNGSYGTRCRPPHETYTHTFKSVRISFMF